MRCGGSHPVKMALLPILCFFPLVAMAAEDVDQVTWLGWATPAEFNRYVPSSEFAQHMMLSQMQVSELEPGVIAMWVPQKDFPHTIFASWDGFEAYGFCTKRVKVGCKMDVFDYAAGEIRSYHMPLAMAERRSTYLGLIGGGEEK